MKFTENEIVFFNSITKGKSMLGLPVTFRITSSKDEEINKTISSLIEKGVLESKSKLSKKGVLPTKAIEDYKTAKKHVIINYLHIAILDNDTVVIIPLKDRKYEVMRLPAAAIMVKLFEEYDMLRVKSNGKEAYNKRVDLDSFLKELKEKGSKNIMLGLFEDGIALKECVYYWDDDNAYRYDFTKGIKSIIDPIVARNELANALCLKESN